MRSKSPVPPADTPERRKMTAEQYARSVLLQETDRRLQELADQSPGNRPYPPPFP